MIPDTMGGFQTKGQYVPNEDCYGSLHKSVGFSSGKFEPYAGVGLVCFFTYTRKPAVSFKTRVDRISRQLMFAIPIDNS